MAMAPYAASSVSFRARPAAFRPRASAGGSARAGKAEGAGGKWWAPLLGWSGRAEYLEAPAPVPAQDHAAGRSRTASSVGGLLTEEKARELRARMVETECFHDAMYHSAIASRLARPS